MADSVRLGEKTVDSVGLGGLGEFLTKPRCERKNLSHCVRGCMGKTGKMTLKQVVMITVVLRVLMYMQSSDESRFGCLDESLEISRI